MRFIHTADWHLGRLFYGVHLTEDQAHVLDQVVGLVADAKPDAMLISGDIYDRAVPPPEAVDLLDDVFSRLVLSQRVPVILIAGNHDSPNRLGFGSRLLAAQGLHVYGPLTVDPAQVRLGDAHGQVCIYPITYAEPSVVRDRLACDSVVDHDTALRALLERVCPKQPAGQRSILVAHAFASGGEVTESERPLSVGGSGTVSVSCFDGFNYVALGHLHRAQSVESPRVQYAGSLMKYSFTEASQAKSVNLVEMDRAGGCTVERIALKPRRDARCIEGNLQDLLRAAAAGDGREDYLMVSLLDTGAILDPMARLREVYPNVLHIERPALMREGALDGTRRDHREMSDERLFGDFFAQVTGNAPTGEEAVAYATIVNEWRRKEREATG